MTSINLFAGFAVNLVIALIIVRFIYYPMKHNKNYIFTFLAFNTTIYFVMSFLANAELSVGVGFGLFAIFSVLRYRTSTMSTREMTYLFILIALPVMNSVLMRDSAWAELLGVNGVVIVMLYLLEQGWGFRYEGSRTVKYERIELIKPENYSLLLQDLRQRTGLPIQRIEIGRLNFLDDSAELKVFYDEPKAKHWLSHEDEPVADERYYLSADD